MGLGKESAAETGAEKKFFLINEGFSSIPHPGMSF